MAYSKKNKYPSHFDPFSTKGRQYLYPREDRNLETIPVFRDDGDLFLEVSGIPEKVGYGKYGCFISVKNPKAFLNYSLK